MSFYIQQLTPMFTDKLDWDFKSDADSGNLYYMSYNQNPLFKFEDVEGYDSLPSFVKDTLNKGSIYSSVEVEGWTRIALENQRLIDMFGGDELYVPPESEDAIFFKALDEWFSGLPYMSELDSIDIGSLNYKSYGLTQSLSDALFGKTE